MGLTVVNDCLSGVYHNERVTQQGRAHSDED